MAREGAPARLGRTRRGQVSAGSPGPGRRLCVVTWLCRRARAQQRPARTSVSGQAHGRAGAWAARSGLPDLGLAPST